MLRSRWIRLVAGVFVLALVLAACSSGGDGGGGGGGSTTGTSGGGGGGWTSITIEGFAFHPATVQVSGETTLSITNNDGTTHTFTLDDGSVDEEIPAGQTVQVTVNVSQTTGFHCKIHPTMTGTLQVA